MNSMGLAKPSVCFAWIALAGLAFGAGQGCSGGKKGDPNGRVVAGKVSYQGNPIEGAFVTFASPSASAFGQTDSEGKFKLTASSGEKVPLGAYQVSIVKKEQTARPPPQSSLIPSIRRITFRSTQTPRRPPSRKTCCRSSTPMRAHRACQRLLRRTETMSSTFH